MAFKNRTAFMGAAAALAVLLFLAPAPTARGQEAEPPPDGAELYKGFMAALDEMDSFSFDSRYIWNVGGKVIGDCTFRYFLKKPDLYRVEVINPQGEMQGLLVCDGGYCWTTWPLGTSIFTQHTGSFEREKEVYLRERAYRGKSISHQLSLVQSMPVFNANAFFGGEESVMAYLDDIEYLDEEDVGGEPCHVLKVSMMEGQRVRTIWLSQNDHLPRKLLGELVVANPQTSEETWSNLRVDTELADGLFRWTPPQGFEERRLPTVEERILQVGDSAADFTLDDAEGKRLSLAEFEDKIIWLMFWRIG